MKNNQTEFHLNSEWEIESIGNNIIDREACLVNKHFQDSAATWLFEQVNYLWTT